MTSSQGFCFLDPGRLVDGDLELVLVAKLPADPIRGWVPCYHFEMRRTGFGTRLGSIRLRVGHTQDLDLYDGQIGYGVDGAHRGHHYAARGCRLLFPLAKAHGLSPLWITCNPDNWASRRTCELAGGVLVEIVDTAPDSDAYLQGEHQKCRYRFDL
ncbi:MAG: GNAT family N-acetyltransferase [Anaerolineae bacterium]|nr:GNAT family N-acetyltransferase [Anaerolineae bacterium]